MFGDFVAFGFAGLVIGGLFAGLMFEYFDCLFCGVDLVAAFLLAVVVTLLV